MDDLNAIGHVIAYDGSNRFGYGFVIEPNHYVITCAHVALNDTMLLKRYYEKKLDTIIIYLKLPEYDLAIYKLKSIESVHGLRLGGLADFNKTQKGDTVTYLTFKDLKDIYAVKRPIQMIVGFPTGKYTMECLVFDSVGGPGTSGSPVVNYEGKVIAIISHGLPISGDKNQDLASSVSLKPIISRLREKKP
jgi:V8-like Glu-specific endopeptidase